MSSTIFTTEILHYRSHMEQPAPDPYAQLATSLKGDREPGSFERGMEAEEKHQAKVLVAEQAAVAVDSDPGLSIPEFPEKWAEMDRSLKDKERVQSGLTKEDGSLCLV